MRRNGWISTVFVLSGIYDALLGAAFLVSPGALFARFHVPPPNHWGYVQFPAAILIIFGLMFFAVAHDPEFNRNLIPYGVLLKVAFAGIVFWYWFTQGLPDMWKPFAICDSVFAILFLFAWRAVAPRTGRVEA